MTEPTVLAQRDNGVLTITLNRPQSMNALLLDMHHSLHNLFDEFAGSTDANQRLWRLAAAL